MEKIMKKIDKSIVILIITILVLFTGCIGTDDGVLGAGLVRIKGQYKIDGYPSGPWDGVTVVIIGTDSTTLTTGSDGRFSISVALGNYSVSASKAGFDTVTNNITASIEGETHDLGTQVLYSVLPPAGPTFNISGGIE